MVLKTAISPSLTERANEKDARSDQSCSSENECMRDELKGPHSGPGSGGDGAGRRASSPVIMT